MTDTTDRAPFDRAVQIRVDAATWERLRRRATARADTLSSTARELIARRLDDEDAERDRAAQHYADQAAAARQARAAQGRRRRASA